MSAPAPSIMSTQRHQMFPSLLPAEIDRLRRFGTLRAYGAGSSLVNVGEVGHGLTIILTGEVEITQRRGASGQQLIVTHSAGSFMGELAQLSGRPALVDAYAKSPVEALSIAPERLRALLVAEAELGERIMRALILRRMGLIETGAGGPVIVGHPESGDVIRLEGFLSRNGHPHQTLNPDTDPEAKALIERFHVYPCQLPIVLCSGGQLLRNPTEPELARCIGLVGPIDPARAYDVAIIGAGPAGLATAVYAASEGTVRSRAGLPRIRRPGWRLSANRELPGLDVPEPGGFRGVERALLGYAARRKALRRPGGRRCRRRQFCRPGSGLSRKPGRQGMASGAWARLGSEHVALSGGSHRRPSQRRSRDAGPGECSGRPQRNARSDPLASQGLG